MDLADLIELKITTKKYNLTVTEKENLLNLNGSYQLNTVKKG